MEVRGTSGTVSFDGSTVVITRSGLRQVSVSGGLRGEARYAVSQLSGVRIQKPGLHAGQFTLVAAGTNAVGVGAASSGHDPMTVLFQRNVHQAFLELAGAIEEAIRDLAYGRVPVQDAAPRSVVDELARLGQLRDQGLLSDAEFTAAKAQLLGVTPEPQDRRPW
jgi:hypothetical protein